VDQRALSAREDAEGARYEYYAPKNINVWYLFGGLALFVLVLQLVTGIFLTMSYKPPPPRPSPRSNTSCATSSGAG